METRNSWPKQDCRSSRFESQTRHGFYARGCFVTALRHEDSRRFIRELFDVLAPNFTDQAVFAYLDAHWKKDMPLGEVIDLIFDHCAAAVVIIDDFQLPFDADHDYDDYGSGKALTPTSKQVSKLTTCKHFAHLSQHQKRAVCVAAVFC